MKNRLNNKPLRIAPWIMAFSVILLIQCAKEKPARVESLKITPELANLLKPADAVITSDIRTVLPVRRNGDQRMAFKGLIEYDTRKAIVLPSRYSGRIEKLNIKYNFQAVRKGQVVFEIYSPELVTAQQELIFLLSADSGNKEMVEAAAEKLRLLGMSNDQIDEVTHTRKSIYALPVHSPVNGYIVEGELVRGSAQPEKSDPTSTDGGMMGGSTVTQPTVASAGSPVGIREGMYVSAGEPVFRIVDGANYWAAFQIHQQEAGSPKVGDRISITADPSNVQPFTAQIDFVQPYLEDGRNFITLRCYLKSAGSFKVGQWVTGEIVGRARSGLWVPSEAILDLGTEKIIFIKRRGVFRPKPVITGKQSGAFTEVLQGIEEPDSLAVKASYLVDSESFVKVLNR